MEDRPKAPLSFSPDELLGPLNDVERKNAPETLWVRGDVHLLSLSPRVSVVGAREASHLGLKRAEKLARLLVDHGALVVSGLATGIDTAALWGAVKAGGRTIGVLGNPIDVVLGGSDAALRRTMAESHLVVSQFPSGHPVLRSNFPRRNRTMALLSHATVIVEAADSSGSLSQGWEALRLGRPLFLMKSIVDDERLKWPKEMLHYGARTLASGHEDELFELLPPAGEIGRERLAF